MTAAIAPGHPLNVEISGTSTLRDLLEDGIYLLFLLRDGSAPSTGAEFNRRIDAFLSGYEEQALRLGKRAEAIGHVKYAFCALLDEIILSSDYPLRSEWEGMPLQLRLFGDHLAGEGFFDRLDELRGDPAQNVEPLEVFHTCLLLGFQGKYLLEGPERLSYLAHRVGQEILQVRGGKPDFAPHWRLPQRFQSFVRNELPLSLYLALLAVAAAGVFVAYRWLLGSEVARVLEMVAI